MEIIDFNEEEKKVQDSINNARSAINSSDVEKLDKEAILQSKRENTDASNEKITSKNSSLNNLKGESLESLKNDEEEDKLTLGLILKEILSVLCYIAACFLIVFLITSYVGQRTVVSGSSMWDTLYDGDNLIVDKISYKFSDPQRFDIIVFPYLYEEDTYYIKRIIGLPGETVYIDPEGNIYIDGELLEENYGTDVISNAGLAANTIELGEDEYFVLGDNRNNSTDSRFEAVGNIKGSNIVGKAWLRIYPFNKIGLVGNIE